MDALRNNVVAGVWFLAPCVADCCVAQYGTSERVADAITAGEDETETAGAARASAGSLRRLRGSRTGGLNWRILVEDAGAGASDTLASSIAGLTGLGSAIVGS